MEDLKFYIIETASKIKDPRNIEDISYEDNIKLEVLEKIWKLIDDRDFNVIIKDYLIEIIR